MKAVPSFESIAPSFGSSFHLAHFEENQNSKAHVWHYHPEIELVYVNGGSGKRLIGSHVSYYTEGDLILIGSNLPHCGFTNEQTGNTRETVLQLKPDFLGADFMRVPETASIRELFERARTGMAFGKHTQQLLGPEIEALKEKPQFDRLLSMLGILNQLGAADDHQMLNAGGFALQTKVEDNQRVNDVFNFVKDHFKEPIALESVAAIAHMTVPAFCRYFKKITHKTFTKFVNEYRLVHASTLLAEQQLSITEVCLESGFNNFSHFNKSFREFTGKSASAYRQEHKRVMA